MTTATLPDPKTLAAFQSGFFKPAVARIRENLELLMGRSMPITAEAPTVVDQPTLGGLIPPPCVSLSVKVTGDVPGELHWVTSLPLALTMVGLMRMSQDPQIQERLAAAAPPDESEKATLAEIDSFLVAAVTELFASVKGHSLEPVAGSVKLLPGDATDVGALVPPGDYVACTAQVAPDQLPPGAMVLVLPLALADFWAPPEVQAAARQAAAAGAPAAVAGAATVAGSALIAGADAFIAALRPSLPSGTEVSTVAGLSELVKSVEAGASPRLIVVEVQAGQEWKVDVLGALRRHPACKAIRFAVVLERPSRSNVLRCGRAGVLDVIPSGFDPQILLRRISSWFAAPAQKLAAV